jgi:hypothetical protein
MWYEGSTLKATDRVLVHMGSVLYSKPTFRFSQIRLIINICELCLAERKIEFLKDARKRSCQLNEIHISYVEHTYIDVCI